MKSLIVVDCQYDFIDGSLACENAESAVKRIIRYINDNDLRVFYSMDWHSRYNRSFKVNGGIWPEHCVQGERGARIHEDFFKLVEKDEARPSDENVFYKGMDDEIDVWRCKKSIIVRTRWKAFPSMTRLSTRSVSSISP